MGEMPAMGSDVLILKGLLTLKLNVNLVSY